MKRSRIIPALVLALCTLAGIFAINAVSAARRAGIAAELRERDEIRYFDDGVCRFYASPIARKSEETNGRWAEEYSALALVEVEGDWIKNWHLRRGFGERVTGQDSNVYLELRVLDLIGENGDTGLVEGRTFLLGSEQEIGYILAGDRLVIFLRELAGTVDGIPIYGFDALASFWYTNDGYILSVQTDELLDSFSGMTLAEFKRAIAPTLRKSGW